LYLRHATRPNLRLPAQLIALADLLLPEYIPGKIDTTKKQYT